MYALPSTVIYCEVAPAERMAVMAAWFRLPTTVEDSSWTGIGQYKKQHFPQSSKHNLTFIVGIKDDLVIVLELCSNSLPESSKIIGRGDDLAIVTTVIVRYDDGISTKLGNAVDGLRQVPKVGSVQRTSHLVRYQTFHQEVDAEGVHAFVDESFDRRHVWPDVIGSIDAGDVGLAKLGAGFVDADELELARAGRTFVKTERLRKNKACRTSGENKGRDVHLERIEKH